MKVQRIFYLTSLLFFVILAHLFKMQIVDYEYYRNRSERNRIRPVVIEAPRGVIVDRNGREIVSNRLSFDCYIIPQEGKAYIRATMRRLGEILGQPDEDLAARYDAGKRGAFSPVLLADDITKDQAVRVEESNDVMPGVFIKTRPVRDYRLGKAAAHAVGYIGAMNAEEYRRFKDQGYRFSDFIGKTGLEKIYEDRLKGRDGAVQYEADSRGRLLRVLSIQEPVEGQRLELAMDADLQEELYKMLEGQTGAIVVMDLADGGILGIVSSPAFDPNLFVKPARERGGLIQVLSGRGRPLINRAIGAQYPPGSTFKIVTASAGLLHGKINAATSFFCPGYLKVGGRPFKCWEQSGHGSQNVIEAIQHSCNVFFYNLGIRLDVDELSEEARKFGYGQKSGIDLPGEKEGSLPSREWKRKYVPRSPVWYSGESANFAIGQGFMTATPIQVLRSAAVIGSGGRLLEPFLARGSGGKDSATGRHKTVNIRASNLSAIQEGMKLVVQSPTGTARRAGSDLVSVSGKSGTAQAGKGDAHAWFVAYAPSEDPQAAIVVFLEHGGRGGITAATIAGKAFTWMAEHGRFRGAGGR